MLRSSALAALTLTCLPHWAFAADAVISYERDVRPILKANCFHCHGGEGEAKASLDLRLRRFIVKGGDQGPSIEPGKRDDSLLFERINKGEMPLVASISPPNKSRSSASGLMAVRRLCGKNLRP